MVTCLRLTLATVFTLLSAANGFGERDPKVTAFDAVERNKEEMAKFRDRMKAHYLTESIRFK